MKLIEYFLTFQSLFFEFQAFIISLEIQVCKIKTLSFENLEFIFKISKGKLLNFNVFLENVNERRLKLKDSVFKWKNKFCNIFWFERKGFIFEHQSFEFQKKILWILNFILWKFNDSSLLFKD